MKLHSAGQNFRRIQTSNISDLSDKTTDASYPLTELQSNATT